MTGQLYREKYPLIMSWMSAGPPFVKTSIIEPFGPAGTIAEFVTICFWKSFSMDAVGTGAPVGRRVMKPRMLPCGLAVRSTAYPFAVDGMDAQNGEAGTVMERAPPGYDGPPNTPLYSSSAELDAVHCVTG